MIKVIQVYMKNAIRNYNYIIYSDQSLKAIFIDPMNIDMTLPKAKSKSLNCSYLLNTHSHYDHVQDNKRYLETTGAEHLKMSDGEEFFLDDSSYIKAIYTPGHIDPHFCYVIYNNNYPTDIITGDVLFNAGVGNCKNGGNVEVLYETISSILPKFLKQDTNIWPSHDYLLTNLEFSLSVDPDNVFAKELRDRRQRMDLDNEFINTDFATELNINPFLRLDSQKIKSTFKTNKNAFINLRKLRDNW